MNNQDEIEKAKIQNFKSLVLAIAISWPISNVIDNAMGVDDKGVSLLIFFIIFLVVCVFLRIFWPSKR